MNIFVVDESPEKAAEALCDKHVPKMIVETTQMLVSALRRHGATDADVPLTKAGTPHKGGYHNHPATRWVGDSLTNAQWLLAHGYGLCEQFEFRFNKTHACYEQLVDVESTLARIPDQGLTDIALCVGEALQNGRTHAPIAEAVDTYRNFYRIDKADFAKWEKGCDAPVWWGSVVDTNL